MTPVVPTVQLHQQNQGWLTAWALRAWTFLKTISTLHSIVSTSEPEPVG